MWQDFITAFSPFFDGFFGAVNKIIRIFFDIRKKDKKSIEDVEDDEDGIVIDKKNSHFDMRI